uniref:Uncharacterized protein n=1 Tax=Arundo donax TaxID=35708 RepID=A0A0A9G9P8_ARUDO
MLHVILVRAPGRIPAYAPPRPCWSRPPPCRTSTRSTSARTTPRLRGRLVSVSVRGSHPTR